MAEKNPLSTKNRSAPHVKTLIWVCAWCSKKRYPTLMRDEEYTHGICRKHYKKLNRGKDFPLLLIINEVYQRGLNRMHPGKISQQLKKFYRLPDFFLKTATRLFFFQILHTQTVQLFTI